MPSAVSCKPIDIVGGIVKDPVSGGSDYNPNDPDGKLDPDVSWLEKILKSFFDLKLGYKLLVVFVLLLGIAAIWKICQLFFGALIKGIFGGLGAIGRGSYKAISGTLDRRRERKRIERREERKRKEKEKSAERVREAVAS